MPALKRTQKNRPWISRSAAETVRLGKAFARTLRPGDVLCLEGGLGAGKTTFVKGVALGLGLTKTDEVKSPTFVIMHIYPARIPVYHFDLYRLGGGEDLEAIGFEDFANDGRAVTCVEWAEKAPGLLPPEHLLIELGYLSDNGRRLEMRPSGKRYRELLARLKANLTETAGATG